VGELATLAANAGEGNPTLMIVSGAVIVAIMSAPTSSSSQSRMARPIFER
jgi:hypothetical protein